MTVIPRLALAWFASGAVLLTAEQCRLPDKTVQRLVHYQAWSVHWMGTGQEVWKDQELKVLRNGTAWLVYSVPNRTVYRIAESAVSASTCWHQNDWMKCLAEKRTPLEASSLSDLLLGKVRSAGPLDTASICTFSLTVPLAQTKWRPSEENEQKQQFLRLLSEEVARAAKSFGTIQSAVCNNFNVDDPRIWAVVDMIDRTATSNRLLVGMDVDHTVPSRMLASTIRRIASNDGSLVERIRRDSLRLSVQSR